MCGCEEKTKEATWNGFTQITDDDYQLNSSKSERGNGVLKSFFKTFPDSPIRFISALSSSLTWRQWWAAGDVELETLFLFVFFSTETEVKRG